MSKITNETAFANERFTKFIRVMRLTIALMVIACLHVAAAGHTQENVTLNLKSVELRKALITIEKQSDYRFLFNEALLDHKPKVDIQVVNVPVTSVLNQIFQNTGISYKVLNSKLVVLKDANDQMNLDQLQDIRVTGRVTSSDGSSAVGVSVVVKGTKIGTTTDANGNFSLTVPNNAVLVFSSVGYETQEVAVGGRSSINITLVQSTKTIDQVVIVGYGSQRKIDVTGSVGQVKGDEIAKQPDANPLSALQGKVAGVQITNSGAPGAPPSITIRGLGTVYGNPNPLFVVDGIWYDDISFLNANDIESISVLKDASSESIYGIRAANGVILVTTKKGRTNAGKPVISYNGFVGNQIMTNDVKMATGPEFETMINELDVINGKPAQYSNPSAAGTTDWYHQILRNALITSHQVSVAGAGEKSTYNFSLGYIKQDGLVENNTFDRYNLHLQNDYQLARFLKVGYVVNGALINSTDVDGSIFHDLYAAAPNVPVYYADGTYGDPNDFKVGSSNQFNPQVTIDYFNQHTKTYKANGNAFADLKFAKYFTFHTNIGGDYEQAEVNNYLPVYTATLAQRNSVSKLTVTNNQVRNWILENTLTYDRQLPGGHSLKLLIGQGAQEYRFYGMTGSIQNVPAGSGNQYFSLGSASTSNITDNGSLARVSSYFGRLNYAFRDRYLLTASIRADGSSKFTESNRWGYFPSIGVGWVITNEDFMKSQNLFNNLKLRGSWGMIGNMSVPANLSVQTVTQTPAFIYVGGNGTTATGASITTVVPPATYWEKGVGTDVGLEASLLHSKLYLEADWYNKKTEKAIFPIPILGSLGTTSGTIIGNQATFQNQGWEFLATWKDVFNKDWSYSISGNAAINNNKVLNVSTGDNPIYGSNGVTGGAFNTRTILAEPIGEFYGYQVVGIFQSASDIANYKSKNGAVIQPTAQPGDFKYADVNGDGVIDGKDRVVLGNPNPKYIYGINTNLTYKAFDLSLDFQGVAGVHNYDANLGYRFGTENFTEDFYNNRWHGQGTSNVYPSANIGGGNNYLPNSFYVEDASYFRIRNMQLGYTFPTRYFRNSGISKLRVYMNAQNAFNFFRYRGFNPEIGGGPITRGIDVNVYPLYATYNFGVNLSF